jgi:hypothetical protein
MSSIHIRARERTSYKGFVEDASGGKTTLRSGGVVGEACTGDGRLLRRGNAGKPWLAIGICLATPDIGRLPVYLNLSAFEGYLDSVQAFIATGLTDSEAVSLAESTPTTTLSAQPCPSQLHPLLLPRPVSQPNPLSLHT